MGLKNKIPWWLRITAKVLLSRLPVGYAVWKRLGLFVHGDMNQPANALDTFLMHVKTAGLQLPLHDETNFALLELGPGDSVFTALIARAFGVRCTWLVDAGAFAMSDPAVYAGMAQYLLEQGYTLPFSTDFSDIDDVLTKCNACYLTDGVSSLAQIPDNSIDFCLSNAVLEHIPKLDFFRLVCELKRVLKPDGTCVHRVDLKDHLGGGLNNLRFSEAAWEGPLFSRSGFYTNRIRYAEMLAFFEQAGFACVIPRKISWDTLPIARSALAVEFQALPDENLLVSGFDIVLRHKANG